MSADRTWLWGTRHLKNMQCQQHITARILSFRLVKIWGEGHIPVNTQELAMSNMYQLEAMIRILERKGILSKRDVMDELQTMKREDEDVARGN